MEIDKNSLNENEKQEEVVVSDDSEYEVEMDNTEPEETEPIVTIDEEAPSVKRTQLIWGIIAGVGIMLSLFLPLYFDMAGTALSYLFLLIFVVEMIAYRRICAKYNARFRIFMLAWIISMIASLVTLVIIGIATGGFN